MKEICSYMLKIGEKCKYIDCISQICKVYAQNMPRICLNMYIICSCMLQICIYMQKNMH